MLSAETSALVAGGMRAPATAPAPVALRVLRAVMVAGARVEPGSEISVERWFAAELITAGKAEKIEPAATVPTPAAKAAKEKTRAQQ